MAESHDDERIFFVDPEQRGIIPFTPLSQPFHAPIDPSLAFARNS